MRRPKYPLKAEQDLNVFEFDSIGPKGTIPKVVMFTETNLHGFYNLAFGDKIEGSSNIDDTSVTNNEDTEKVLATVVEAVYMFTDKYPEAWVYATGSTAARTRLYRMGIAKYLDEIKNDFHVFGESGEEWKVFDKNVDYEGFVVKRKLS